MTGTKITFFSKSNQNKNDEQRQNKNKASCFNTHYTWWLQKDKKAMFDKHFVRPNFHGEISRGDQWLQFNCPIKWLHAFWLIVSSIPRFQSISIPTLIIIIKSNWICDAILRYILYEKNIIIVRVSFGLIWTYFLFYDTLLF